MSNLIKQSYYMGTSKNTPKKWVINSNAMAEQKVKEYHRQLQAKKTQVISQETDGEAEFIEGFPQEAVQEVQLPDPQEIIDAANERAREILADANAQADELLKVANESVQQIQEQAREQGYKEGVREKEEELQRRQTELENSFSERERSLQNEYETRLQNMEQELVENMLPVFAHVLSVDLSHNEQLLLQLCKKTIAGMEMDKHFYLRTSPLMREELMKEEAYLKENLPSDVEIEFLSDESMSDSDLVIETESGIVDTGVGTLLDGVLKELKKLSYGN